MKDELKKTHPAKVKDIHIGQFNVIFLGLDPIIKMKDKYAVYCLSKSDIELIFENAGKHVWELMSPKVEKPTDRKAFHPTARARTVVSAPIREFLANFDFSDDRSILYHGIGKDSIGFEALAGSTSGRAVAYDPYHPEAAIRAEPKGKFHEIHSHYTLNVVDEDEGLEVLRELYHLLTEDGYAIVGVRRDLHVEYKKAKQSMEG